MERSQRTGERIITLIRHGESEANAELPTSSWENIALTSLGHKQAQQFAEEWFEKLDIVITSTYLRARQTAEPTAKKRGIEPHVWDFVREFTYLDASRWPDGSTWRERKKTVDTYWSRCNPNYRDGPNTETFREFTERVEMVMDGLLHMEDVKHIAVFTHDQFIKAFLWIAQTGKNKPLAMETFRELNAALVIPHCTPITLHIMSEHFEQIPCLDSFKK